MSITAVSPIVIEGQKYYALDDQVLSMELKAEEKNELNVNLRKAYEYNYTIESNLGTTISTGIGIEDETITVPYPRYVNNGGSLYKKDVIDKQYRYSFIPTNNNQVETLDYADANIKNVIYYSEGENISGATATSAGNNMVVRSSNAACGYAAEDMEICNLTPGKYSVCTAAYSNSSAGLTLNFTYGDNTLTHVVNGASNFSTLSQDITVDNTCAFTWKQSGDSKNGLDYIYIQRIADLATVTSVGFATYSPSSNVSVPDDVKVYTVTVDAGGNSVTLNPVPAGSVVEAGTGYVIEAAEGSYPFAVSNEAVSSIGENALTVSDGAVTVGESDNIYVLAQRTDGSVGFSIVASGVTIPAGKAYLDLSGSQAKASFLSFGNIVTAIESTESTTKAGNGVYYSLQGIRTSAPAKGLYIINGKKVVVK